MCAPDVYENTVNKEKVRRQRWGRGLLYLPAGRRRSGLGHLPLSPGTGLSEQCEEDFDVTALGKQLPENISNPMYDSATSAPPEPSYDPFMVSWPDFSRNRFHLGAGG